MIMECVRKILISRPAPLGPIHVPCGQCIACRLNRASDWAVRIMNEKSMSHVSYFVTLTYDDNHLTRVGDYATLVKRDVQLFLKRLRKELAPVKVRYYLCGEYGETYGRPHYHIILFLDSDPSDNLERYLASAWRFGFVHIGDVSFDSAQYVARYCTKLLTGKAKEWYIERGLLPEFALMSRRPGIGAAWLEKFGNEVKSHHSVVAKGRKMSPPRYYRDKVYDESDRFVVRSSVLDKVVKRIKAQLEYDKSHSASDVYENAMAEVRDYGIKSRLQMKSRSKL